MHVKIIMYIYVERGKRMLKDMDDRRGIFILVFTFALMTLLFFESFDAFEMQRTSASFKMQPPSQNKKFGVVASNSMKRPAYIRVLKTYYKKYPNSRAFKLGASSNADTKLNFKSSNTKVVQVSNIGKVTIKGYGTAKIKIISPVSKRYKYTTKTVTVKVADDQNLRAKKTSYNLKYGADTFALDVISDRKDTDEFQYSSGNTDVARVSEDGNVRITGLGSTIISVESPESKHYHKDTLKILISVSKRKQKLTLAKTKYTVSQVDWFTKIQAMIDSGQDLKYESSDKNIVAVTQKGVLHPKNIGKCTVKVYQEGDEFYLLVSKTITVTVRKSDLEDERLSAVAWAKKIANNNDFAYGTGKGAHHNGCYFCGTNFGPNRKLKPSKKYLKTYCCNPFVTAAFAHGAKSPAMLAACKKGTGVGLTKKSFTKFGCWKCLGKPALSSLVPGDVFVRNNRHAAIYIGNNQFVEAGHSGWGADSIAVSSGADKRYASRVTYVMRYIGG